MADDVAITAGSGTLIAADNRTINSASVYVQRVVCQGSTTMANGQVAPTNSAATLLAARDTRQRVIFLNSGTVTVYIGIATVTTGNGFRLAPGASVTLYTQVLIQAITASGTGSIDYIEEFDS